MTLLIPCVWDGASFTPLRGHVRRVTSEIGAGEVVTLAPVENRSAASHNHYFACLNEVWQNLSPDQVTEYPTPEHLRKKGLVHTGWSSSRDIVASSRAEALRIAAFIRPMDEYAVIQVINCVVRVSTAQSQRVRAMGNKAFQKSKSDVLDWCAGLIGSDVETIKREAGQAA